MVEEQLDLDEDEAFGVADRVVNDVLEAVEAQDANAVEALLEPLHAADVAHLIEREFLERDDQPAADGHGQGARIAGKKVGCVQA